MKGVVSDHRMNIFRPPPAGECGVTFYAHFKPDPKYPVCAVAGGF